MLYKILFSLHTFVAGIIAFSTVATLPGLATGPRPKPKEITLLVARPANDIRIHGLIYRYYQASGRGTYAWDDHTPAIYQP